MNGTRLFRAALFATAGAPLAAWPQQPGESRAQVKAEARESLRKGDVEVGDEGRKANEVNPRRYPPAPAAAGATRAEVKAEAAQARKAGELPSGDLDETPKDLDPKRYPAAPAAPGPTRAQVKQETLAAIRAGDIQVGEDGKTLAQKDPARYANGGQATPRPRLHLPHRAKPRAAASASQE